MRCCYQEKVENRKMDELKEEMTIVNTLGLLSMGILFAPAVLYLSPGLLFIFPAVWGIFIVNNCRMVVEEELADE